jgi:hypothetical protein
LNSGRNWLDVMFGVLYCMAQRPGHSDNWSGSRELRNVVLEENREDKNDQFLNV